MSDYQKYGKIAFFLVGLVLAGWVLLPFLRTILLALVLAYAFNPVYRRIQKIVRLRGLASITTIIFIVLCLVIPAIFVTNAVVREATAAYSNIMSVSDEFGLDFDAPAEFLNEKIGVNLDLESTLRLGVDYLTRTARDFVTTVPEKILNFFILLFLLYYMFKEHKGIKKYIVKLLPFPKQEKQRILVQFNDVVYGVIYGQMVTAVIQGAIAGIGYWLFGMNIPILWAIITMIMALVPLVGTAIVWVPVSIYLFIVGLSTGTWWQGIGLLIYGVLIISSVDNFIRPVLISGKSRIHPALVLLGALGGIGVFGVIGIIIGPLVIAMFMQLLTAYQQKHS